MSFFSSKKFSPSNLALANGRFTKQLPPPPKLQSPSHQPQQQEQRQPVSLWSEHHLNLLPTVLSKDAPPCGPSPSPFPRYGHALSATATAAGELFLFGGFVQHSPSNDLYVFSTRDLSATLLQTTGEAPSPRAGHAGARIGTVLLIWGGVTNIGDRGVLIGPDNDSLYLLDLVSRVWTCIMHNGSGPVSRYDHAVTVVGSKLFVFGGVVDGIFMNDMWAFDLDSQKSNPVWDSYDSAPGDKMPPPRGGHVLVNIGDLIILFGGAGSQDDYKDTWLFDVSTRKWTEVQCTGYTPTPRRGHAAAIVDDVMYVFGGRGVDGADLDELIAFKLSTQRWSTFQNTGQSPSKRWCHAIASEGTEVFVLGGISSTNTQGDEAALIHILDTKQIMYPDPDSNVVKPSEETTQLARKSSASSPTQERPQHPTSSSPDAYAAHGASPFHEATPSLGRLERERFVDPERQLSATLPAQSGRDLRLAQLTDRLTPKSALPEQAELNAAEATKHAGLELAERLLAQVEQKDAELVKMQAKLDELLLYRDQNVRSLEQALRIATSRSADADERSREQVRLYETELAKVRAKLEARESELEAVRLRLKDAEDGWAKSRSETDTLRAMTAASLVSTDEDRITRELVERIRVMEAEMSSLRLSEKSSEAMQSRNEG